ncbi:pulmonary surfactant-associated protein B isoform X4 [Gallus gallus]|uniref:pulmonary surfactant-associated protein B isoform X4 n=1 Tax=Gallus gallus TaxID=9031 RepID=UPI001AE7D6D1|nr:pulmonary surfactant-associated protein B isoform X4 [Gallus gallus]
MAPLCAAPLCAVLLCAAAGLGGLRCEAPPRVWSRSWDTALRCGAGGGCAQPGRPHSTQEEICSGCQDVLSLLIRVANTTAVQAAVEGFVQRECAALPLPGMEAVCRTVARTDRHGAAALLGGAVKPSAICALLELCPGQPGGVPAVSPHIGALLKDAALPVPLPLCWLCRTFLARAEAAIPKEAVAAAVAQLCRALPLAVEGACQCLAERYAALALEAALGRMAPRLLCRLLLSCGPNGDGTATAGGAPPDPAAWQALAEPSPNLKLTPKPGLTPKLGPCALGPAYWCSSAETARRCEAELYCREHSGL